jgi:hypothetical protein
MTADGSIEVLDALNRLNKHGDHRDAIAVFPAGAAAGCDLLIYYALKATSKDRPKRGPSLRQLLH